MITDALSIVFGISVPLSLVVVGGRYVFLTGNFGRGFFVTWGLVTGYYWLTFILPLVVFGLLEWKQASDYAAAILPDSGPGVFAVTVMGWIPSAITVGIALTCRALWRKPIFGNQ